MNYRRIGNTGLTVSEIAYGSWLTFGSQVDLDKAKGIIRNAFDLGINYIDCADVYANGKAEELLGEVLPKEYRRQDYVLATKVYFPMSDSPTDRGLSRKHIVDSIHASLSRLGLDYVDIYYCHRFDTNTPVEETIMAMQDLIRQGKILYWGVSQWTADQIARAAAICRENRWNLPAVNQPSYSLLVRNIEERILPVSAENGIGTASFSPLAQGILTGKYSGGTIPEGSRAADERINRFIKGRLSDKEILDRVDQLGPIAKNEGITMAQLAIAFLLRRSEVSSVIVGASNQGQLEENAGASGVQLSEDSIRRLDELFPA
jgi:voltage-dependent potassium channel beta subunit